MPVLTRLLIFVLICPHPQLGTRLTPGGPHWDNLHILVVGDSHLAVVLVLDNRLVVVAEHHNHREPKPEQTSKLMVINYHHQTPQTWSNLVQFGTGRHFCY